MNYYCGKEMAASFRTVRKNTLTIAEDIPAESYSFRPTEESQTVGELLTHVAMGARFPQQVLFVEKRSSMVGFDFMKFITEIKAETAKPRTKAEIVELLKAEGEKFAHELEACSEEFLGQSISLPPGGNQPSRTHFDLLLGVKEHEMHHRGQLMLIERMLGLTPHLTREQQARMTSMREAIASKA